MERVRKTERAEWWCGCGHNLSEVFGEPFSNTPTTDNGRQLFAITPCCSFAACGCCAPLFQGHSERSCPVNILVRNREAARRSPIPLQRGLAPGHRPWRDGLRLRRGKGPKTGGRLPFVGVAVRTILR
jgi:hypothetical protein